jgi:hypothetical protein
MSLVPYIYDVLQERFPYIILPDIKEITIGKKFVADADNYEQGIAEIVKYTATDDEEFIQYTVAFNERESRDEFDLALGTIHTSLRLIEIKKKIGIYESSGITAKKEHKKDIVMSDNGQFEERDNRKLKEIREVSFITLPSQIIELAKQRYEKVKFIHELIIKILKTKIRTYISFDTNRPEAEKGCSDLVVVFQDENRAEYLKAMFSFSYRHIKQDIHKHIFGYKLYLPKEFITDALKVSIMKGSTPKILNELPALKKVYTENQSETSSSPVTDAILSDVTDKKPEQDYSPMYYAARYAGCGI